jgi:aminoglycoside phosphotransferase (APT) family kinase protein
LIEKKKKLDVLLKTNLLHHNDLHARNILLDEDNDRLAIIDFGEANAGPSTCIGNLF